MTPSEFLAEIQGVRSNVVDFPANIFLKFLFAAMAEHVHDLRLPRGRRLLDAGDFKEFFELAAKEAGEGPKLRIVKRLDLDLVCPICGHKHELAGECGVSMGGAGRCDCKVEVRV